jgi:hypothetical protein
VVIENFKKLLRTPAGKFIAGGILVIALIAMVFSYRTSFAGFSGANSKTYIDLDTGKPFQHTLVDGDRVPLLSPSGKNNGYPAEACYWNADGTPKTEPTWVLLNQFTKKSGPTFCPECGRLVINNNPVPVPGQPPAPTKSEYEKNPSKYPLFN